MARLRDSRGRRQVCGDVQDSQLTALPTVLIGTPAPAFVGPELHSGEPISLSRFHGKVVVINFWASWCEECKVEHENLLKINERFSLQFRLETFNLLNRANFGDPGNNVRLATFGTITSTPELQSAKEGGGAVVGGSSARTMQGVLKLVF